MPAPLPVERTGPHPVRIGNARIDTASREVAIPGRVNDAPVLEWVANTEGGFKAYESAITLETDAIAFNTALLLIGLDKSHARLPTEHFDRTAPQGDQVEIWIEWKSGAEAKRVRVEQLLYDRRTNAPLPEAPWVYTGSTFIPGTTQYLAQIDGVLIGFVHSPAPVIETTGAGSVGAWGAVILNKAVIVPGTAVTLIVKAISPKGPR